MGALVSASHVFSKGVNICDGQQLQSFHAMMHKCYL